MGSITVLPELSLPRTGIILQARTGSTRLPNKVVRPFYRGQSILDILLEKLQQTTDLPVVLATTDNTNDDNLEVIAKRHNVLCFRGSEENVLQRFVEAARQFDFEFVIRVCADNPFLSRVLLEALYQKARDLKFNFDYLSFAERGKPTILTHYGVFVELARVAALEKALQSTDNSFYLEHVTNFLYRHPADFNIQLFDISDDLFVNSNIRLTVDTEADFTLVADLYNMLLQQFGHTEVTAINAFLSQHPERLAQMQAEIIKNEKK